MAEQFDIKLYKRNNKFFVIISKEDSLQSVIDKYNLGELTDNNLLELNYNEIDNSDNLLTMIADLVPIKTGEHILIPGYKNQIKSNEELLRKLLAYLGNLELEEKDNLELEKDFNSAFDKETITDLILYEPQDIEKIILFCKFDPISLVLGTNLFIGTTTITGLDDIMNKFKNKNFYKIKINFLKKINIKTIFFVGELADEKKETDEFGDLTGKFNYFNINFGDLTLNKLWDKDLKIISLENDDLDFPQIWQKEWVNIKKTYQPNIEEYASEIIKNQEKENFKKIEYLFEINIIKLISQQLINIYSEKKKQKDFDFINWFIKFISNFTIDHYKKNYKTNPNNYWVYYSTNHDPNDYIRYICLIDEENKLKNRFMNDCLKFLKIFNYIDFYKKFGNILVHCNAGESRSGAVIVGYLMKKNDLDFYNALLMAKKSRFIIRPSKYFILILLFLRENNYEIVEANFTIEKIKDFIEKNKRIIFYDYEIKFIKENINFDKDFFQANISEFTGDSINYDELKKKFLKDFLSGLLKDDLDIIEIKNRIHNLLA